MRGSASEWTGGWAEETPRGLNQAISALSSGERAGVRGGESGGSGGQPNGSVDVEGGWRRSLTAARRAHGGARGDRRNVRPGARECARVHAAPSGPSVARTSSVSL